MTTMDRFHCNFAVKFADAAAAAEGTFTGYGSVFDVLDAHGDIVEPGAFKKTLREAKKAGRLPPMLLNHGGWGMGAEDDLPIGIWTSMEEDDVGLRVEGKLADTQRARDVHQLLKMTPRPAISGLSIGYIAKQFIVGTKPDEPRRRLKEIELVELSLVTMPANDKARVSSVKSVADLTEREFERWLMRDAGLSRSEALVVINRGFKALKAMRDAGGEMEEVVADYLGRLVALKP